MTEEELREKIADYLYDKVPCFQDEALEHTNYILTLIREAGWKSPEEVQEICKAYFHTLYGHSIEDVLRIMGGKP